MILVGQQVHVVGERAGGFLVLVHTLEDSTDGVMDLEIARGEPERRLRLGERFIEVSARGERFCHPVMPACQIRHPRQRVAILSFRVLEPARGPERVAVERQHLGTAGIGLGQTLRLAARQVELGDAQRR